MYSERALEPMEIAVRRLGSKWLKKKSVSVHSRTFKKCTLKKM